MTYLALVDDDWRLDRKELVRVLQRDWPDSVVELAGQQGVHPIRDVVWRQGSGEEAIEGMADESGQCIYLDGANPVIAEFVAWYRRIVPEKFIVTFTDDSYSFDEAIEPGVGASEILALLSED